MDPVVTSSLISAGSSFLGGAFGGGEKRPRYTPYIRALVGPSNFDKKGMSLSDAERFHQSNMFAGRISDAKNNGIHPIYALGAPTFNTPPMQVGSGGGSNFGDTFASVGQDLGRAFHAYSTREERAIAAKDAALTLENKSLQNDLLRSQIRSVNSAGSPPGMSSNPFIPGQAASAVEIQPTVARPRGDYNQRGTNEKPFYQVVNGPGGRMVTASDDVLEMMEQDPLLIPQWYGNMLLGIPAKLGRDFRGWLDKTFK